MSKSWAVAVLFAAAAAAGSWSYSLSSHRSSPIAAPEVTCGTKHCGPNSICCPSCTTGELRCSSGPRCPECAPR
jgi:hypothetical protein